MADVDGASALLPRRALPSTSRHAQISRATPAVPEPPPEPLPGTIAGPSGVPAGSGGLTGRAGWVPVRWVDATPATWDTSRPVAAWDMAPGREAAADPEPRCPLLGFWMPTPCGVRGEMTMPGDEGHRVLPAPLVLPWPPVPPEPPVLPEPPVPPVPEGGAGAGPPGLGRGAEVRVVTVDTSWLTVGPAASVTVDTSWSVAGPTASVTVDTSWSVAGPPAAVTVDTSWSVAGPPAAVTVDTSWPAVEPASATAAARVPAGV